VTPWRVLVARVRSLFVRHRMEDDLNDEIHAHLELLAAEHMRNGLSPDDARRAARRDFGGVEGMKERFREQRGFFSLDAFSRDVRYALRTLLRAPGFAVAAVSTLALGIGATTAIFSVAHAALLRPLPYPGWTELRTVRTTFTDGRVTSGLVGPLEMARLQDPALPIVRAAMSLRIDATLLRDGQAPLALVAAGVDEHFFPLFDLPLQLGAGFTPDQFASNAPAPSVVLSHHLWVRIFGSDPHVVGKTIRLVDGDLRIVGVASRDMDVPRGTDLWLNMHLNPESTDHSYDGYLRVRPGTTPERLSGSLAIVAARLGKDYPGPEGNRAFIVEPLVDTLVGDLRPILIIVLSATALLLVLACVNVTNLLLARATRRSREIAIRAAVGATRTRIMTQLLVESLVIAAAGAVAGLALAYGGVRVLLLYGASRLPRLDAVPFDSPVLLFAIAMLVISAIGVGLAPALQLGGGGLERYLSDGGRTVTGARLTHRALRTMIVAEVAVAVTIVAGAGLLARSFVNLQRQDPGFESRGRLTFNVLLPFSRYGKPDTRRVWSETLLTNLQHIRGVTAVGAASEFPLRDAISSRPLIEIAGWPESHEHVVALMRIVTPEFFKAMGMRVRQGRGFTGYDRATTVPVAIVNEAFVRKYLPDRDPLTAQMSFGFPRVNPASQRAIVGVVNDVKYASLWSSADPAFYLVQEQAGITQRQSIVVAAGAGDPTALIPAIRAEVEKIDPQLALTVEPVTAVVASTLARQKLGTTLMLLFGAVALLLATVGIYGMIAYATGARHGEIATRMALGATGGRIFWLLSRQGLTVAAAGAAIGMGVAYGAGRLVASWLYEVRASDPLILMSALLVVLGVTMVATLLPIRKACQINPSASLRFE
jgi:putative ABC transport system permease protein